MQEYWESYMRPLEGHPAMIGFNADVSGDVPDLEHGYVAFVKVMLKRPTDKGLVDPDEADTLMAIEDRLEMESLRYRSGKYIGRIITQGEVDLIYYLRHDFEWQDTVVAAMRHFESYTYQAGSREDSEWEVYQKLLFPTLKEWQLIHNHHACDRLRQAGDVLKTKRAIEHTMFFEAIEDRAAFTASIIKEGFSIQAEMAPTADLPFYGLQFYRIDPAEHYDIDTLTLGLIESGERFDGQYDGWETSLVKH